MLFSWFGKNILKSIIKIQKKIFVLIPWYHPAYKAGGPIQSIANMLCALENYEFNIFCSNKDLDGSLLNQVAFNDWVTNSANTKVWYSSNNDIHEVLQAAIKKLNPAHLFIIGLYDWQYNIKPLLFCRGVKKIVSVRGMLHPGALSQKGFKKKIFLQFWKMMGLHKRVVFHATDEAEKKYIQDVFGVKVNVKVAANFPKVFNVQPLTKKEPGHLKLFSVALVSPMKNILLVLQALSVSGESSIVSGESEVVSGESSVGSTKLIVGNKIEYHIYGPVKDAAYWETCKELINTMPANVMVKYHGAIAPVDVEDAIAANHVFILPSKSENYGHSIVEALYAGRPVITSNNTPWNELQPAKAGINVSITEKEELFNAISHFTAMNQAELETWSKGARAYAEKAIDIDNIRKQYEAMFG